MWNWREHKGKIVGPEQIKWTTGVKVTWEDKYGSLELMDSMSAYDFIKIQD